MTFKGHTDPLHHIWRFEWQCGMTPKNDTSLLKQFLLSLRGIVYEWYRTLYGITISTWAIGEEGFLKNMFIKDKRRIKHIPWDPSPDDHNDANLVVVH